jgi:hypothetical protein
MNLRHKDAVVLFLYFLGQSLHNSAKELFIQLTIGMVLVTVSMSVLYANTMTAYLCYDSGLK